MSTTPAPVLTQAEQYTQLVPTLKKGDALDLEAHGAMFLICFSAPTATGVLGENIPGPEGVDMEQCDVTAYQFADGSLVWTIDTPAEKYAVLLGYYNGLFIQGQYVKPLAPRDDE